MNTNAKIFLGVIGLLVLGVVLSIVLGVGPSGVSQSGPGEYDQFATCLKDEGAVFYGTFWCKFCNQQKSMFGSSQKLLPYVECSNPDARSQTQVCIDKGIGTYPTWEFADGSRVEGVVPLETLAEKTSCSLTPIESPVAAPLEE